MDDASAPEPDLGPAQPTNALGDEGRAAGSEPQSERALDEAWEKVEAQWEEPEAHRRFIGLATALDALPQAGARYREAQMDPARAERATAGVDKILQVALSRMELNRSPERKPPRVALFLVALALSLGLVGGALWAYLGG